MVTHKCERCKKKFYCKNNYGRHQNRKKPCKFIPNDIETDDDVRCKFCDKYLSSPASLKRHIEDSCKKNKESTEYKILKNKYTNEDNNKKTTKPSKNKDTNNINKHSNKRPSRTLSESIKKDIAASQRFKCANRYGNLPGIEGHLCPLWLIPGVNQGIFDEDKYEVDHIDPFSKTANDNKNNLQALCKICHSVKTNRFNSNQQYGYTINNSADDIERYIYCYIDILMNRGISIDKIIQYLKKLQIKKLHAKYLLDMLPLVRNQHSLILAEINQTPEINNIDLIIKLLTQSYVFRKNIDCETIHNKINEEKKITSFLKSKII